MTKVAGLTLLLALAAPGSRGSASLEHPRAVVAILRPGETLPKIRRTTDLLLGKRSPLEERPGDALAKLGLDLLAPGTLERAGVKLDEPIWIVIPSGDLAPVVELTLARPELADAAIRRALETVKGARAIGSPGRGKRASDTSEDGLGVYLGEPDDPEVVVWRSGNHLFAQPTRARLRSPAEELGSLRFAKASPKPVIPKFSGVRPPDVALNGMGEEGIERVEAGLWIEEGRVDVRTDLYLDFTTGLLLGDLAASPGKSAPLFSIADPAFDLTAFLGPSAIANAFELESMPVEHARALRGRFHAVLSSAGSLVAAAELDEKADELSVGTLSAALAKRYPDAKIQRSTPRLLTIVFPGKDETAVRQALAQASPRDEVRAPVELRVDPKTAFDALSARADARQGPTPPRARVSLGRYLLGDLVRHSSALKVEVSFGPGVVRAKSALALD